MTETHEPVLVARAEQALPTLTDAEIARLMRFGERRTFADGAALVRIGETGHGIQVVLSGDVEISHHDETGHRIHITTHHPGNFIGEIAQLSGRPSLVEAHAIGAVEVLAVAPERLRALLMAEARIGERIMRALILRRVGLLEASTGGPVIIGRAEQADVLRLEGFLERNGHPYTRLDPDSEGDAATVIERFHVAPEELPIVLCPGGQLLRNPSEAELGRCIGLVRPVDPEFTFDVAVVGAGPAGLATAVYAASEGLSVLAIDCRAFGGQAGASARIENYLGFPTGISGMALMARAVNQAQKFGVEMMIPAEAVRLEPGSSGMTFEIDGGVRVRARSAVIATGARYRRLEVRDVEAFEGSSIHFWASPLEAKLCQGEPVALVGGGNSAGQAVVFLAESASSVTLLARRPLAQTMSAYLVERIAGLANVEVIEGVEVDGLEGSEGELDGLSWRCLKSGEQTRRAIRQLFLFIGAEPNTDWLGPAGLELDDRGFVRTGASCTRDRLPLETSLPGVFAVGDVRSGSVKRVASAVGDGAQAVASLHVFLAREREAAVPAPVAVPA